MKNILWFNKAQRTNISIWTKLQEAGPLIIFCK
jgi:hypothetical protein